MFDARINSQLKPWLQRSANLVPAGVSANSISALGLLFALVSAASIAYGYTLLALIPLLISRLCDGLDGALARARGSTDLGAFLDIVLDFIFYALIPLSFALLDPSANALAAALLLASFIGTGISFLAFALIAERRGLTSTAYPQKGIYYLGGICEGFETIGFFVLVCLLPNYFAPLAYGFAAICTLSAALRIFYACQIFRDDLKSSSATKPDQC